MLSRARILSLPKIPLRAQQVALWLLHTLFTEMAGGTYFVHMCHRWVIATEGKNMTWDKNQKATTQENQIETSIMQQVL